MNLNKDAILYCKQNWMKLPLSALASKFGVDLITLTSELRKAGELSEVQPHELQFIKRSIKKMPASEIKSILGLKNSQFSQICEKVLGIKRRKSHEAITLSEAIEKTKWIIEEKLKLPVDDFLPVKIRGSHFITNDLYNCIAFATNEKEKDPIFRYFPAVAFLVCNSYPNVFQPFQFRHSKENEYFKGKSGKKNILQALRWMISEKLKLDLKDLEFLAHQKYFLRIHDLEFYGISPHYFRKFFPSKKELIHELLATISEGYRPTRTMAATKRSLKGNGLSANACEIPNCNFQGSDSLDLHHILPKSMAKIKKIDPNKPENLIHLCPNHHRMAHGFDWKRLSIKDLSSWRKQFIEYILENENGV